MIRTTVALVLAIPLTVGLARAADLPLKAPAAPPSVYSWTGNYFGGDLGVRGDNIRGSVTSVLTGTPATAGVFGPGNSFDSAAFRAGLFIGRNWQLDPRWVVGIEADGSWANQKKTLAGSPYPSIVANSVTGIGGPFPVSATPDSSFAVRTTWDASLRVRGGWLVTPSVLLYGTGGIAFTDLKTTGTCTTVAQPPGTTSSCAPGNYFFGQLGPVVNTQSTILVGGTVGVGVEAKFAPNWTWRAEYRYSDFGTRNFTDTRTCTGACGGGLAAAAATTPLVVNYSMRVYTQVAFVGVAYQF